MPFYNFKGWDLVDGSKVSKDEIEKAFAAVMLKAKKIENTYILKHEQRRKAIRFRAIVAAAAIVVLLIICPITIQHYLEKQHADYTASVEINTSRGLLPFGSPITPICSSQIARPATKPWPLPRYAWSEAVENLPFESVQFSVFWCVYKVVPPPALSNFRTVSLIPERNA